MKVLVVDDSPEQINFLRAVINRLGHDIVSFLTINEAQGCTNFDIALIDQNLEDGQGIDLINYFSKAKVQARFYLISATKPKDEFIKHLNSLGADFLQKPLSPVILSKILS